ncbi:MAG: 1,4-alpha-glucan branching enzyme, partial [Halioglobus sp.]|nr:1,4-alpha-glucan branching enzyme [Halioglobus sp.]
MQPISHAHTATADITRLLAGQHHDPFEVLGCHRQGKHWVVRALLPDTAEATILVGGSRLPLQRITDTDLFTCQLTQDTPVRYQLRWRGTDGQWRQAEDPYRFSPVVGDLDLHLFGQGKHEHIYRVLGAHCCEHDGVPGVRFATWAPNARRVSVVGDFNQ